MPGDRCQRCWNLEPYCTCTEPAAVEPEAVELGPEDQAPPGSLGTMAEQLEAAPVFNAWGQPVVVPDKVAAAGFILANEVEQYLAAVTPPTEPPWYDRG